MLQRERVKKNLLKRRELNGAESCLRQRERVVLHRTDLNVLVSPGNRIDALYLASLAHNAAGGGVSRREQNPILRHPY